MEKPAPTLEVQGTTAGPVVKTFASGGKVPPLGLWVYSPLKYWKRRIVGVFRVGGILKPSSPCLMFSDISDCWNGDSGRFVTSKCSLCTEMFFMCWNILYVLKCSLCTEMFFMYWNVLCVLICSLCTEMFFVYWNGLYVLKCSLCTEMFFVYWNGLYVLKCSLCTEMF